MEQKRKFLMTSLLSLIASAVALTSFTYAWINHDQALGNIITLTSGDSEAKIETHVFERQYATSGSTPVEVANYVDASDKVNATTVSADNGVLQVAFSDVMLDYDLLTEVYDENSLYGKALPSFYVEVRVIKEFYFGYLSANISYVSIPTATSSELDLSSSYPFDYRYLTVTNSTSSPMVSAIPSKISTLEAKTASGFFNSSAVRTNGITLFDTTDLQGSPLTSYSGLAAQCYIPGFSKKVNNAVVFAKSLVIEVYLDPEILASYIRSHSTIDSVPLRFGIDFKVNVRYSNNPILA